MVEQLERTKAMADRLRLILDKRPGDLTLSDADRLRRESEGIGFHVSKETRDKHAAGITEAQAGAAEVAGEVERVCHVAEIREAGRQVLVTAAAALKVHIVVDRALDALRRRGHLPPELEAEGVTAKQRAARFRTQKKLDEAEVAEVGGNAKKATRLRAEAEVLWRQDFGRAFSPTPVPSLVGRDSNSTKSGE